MQQYALHFQGETLPYTKRILLLPFSKNHFSSYCFLAVSNTFEKPCQLIECKISFFSVKLIKLLWLSLHQGTYKQGKLKSVCQSVSPSVRQSVSSSVRQSVSPSVRQFVSPSDCQSVSHSAIQPFSHSAIQLFSQLASQPGSLSVCQSVSLSICPCVRQSVSSLVFHSFSPSFRLSASQPLRQSVSQAGRQAGNSMSICKMVCNSQILNFLAGCQWRTEERFRPGPPPRPSR